MSLAVVKILLALASVGLPILIVMPKSDMLRYALAAVAPLVFLAICRLVWRIAEDQAYINAAHRLHAVRHQRAQKRGSFAGDD